VFGHGGRSPSPDVDDRDRRRAILDAAIDEFSAHGYPARG